MNLKPPRINTGLFGGVRGKTSLVPAQPPGTLLYTGERRMESPRITIIEYDATTCDVIEDATLEQALACRDNARTSWINIDGLHDTVVLQGISDRYGLHALVMEDVLSTSHRPKAEDHEQYLFAILRMLYLDAEGQRGHTEQLSMVLGPRYLLSFQETTGDVFAPVRARIDQGRPRIRGAGPDYLAYALIDAVVDNYSVVVEKIGERVDALDVEMTASPSPRHLRQVHQHRRELLLLARQIYPVRDVIDAMMRPDAPLITTSTRQFLKDVSDHVTHSVDLIGLQRELVSGLEELYHATMSNRMNEVMKVLTIISTIFVPLTFLAGIYGMNFDVLPELRWKWAYPTFWVVALCIGLMMLRFFRRRGWI